MDLVRGNPTEVKVVLASVATALAIYQVALAAIFHRKLRPAFLDAAPAAWTHRASGDTIAVLLIAVAARLGPTSAAELEAQEERQEERLEQQEERREDRGD